MTHRSTQALSMNHNSILYFIVIEHNVKLLGNCKIKLENIV